MRLGNWKRAYAAVRHLVECLTSSAASKMENISAKSSHIIPQILLSNYFDGILLKNSTVKGFQWSGDLTGTSSQFQSSMNYEPIASNIMFPSSSTTSELNGFGEPLENLYQLAALTNTQKTQILAIIDLLGEVSIPHISIYESLDEPGRR